jgi:hypothetical protein
VCVFVFVFVFVQLFALVALKLDYDARLSFLRYARAVGRAYAKEKSDVLQRNFFCACVCHPNRHRRHVLTLWWVSVVLC